MRLLLALVFLVLAWPPHAVALQTDKAFHHYVHRKVSLEQGLPQISVRALAQDPTGYLWVGTQGGLARFDGVRFTTYTPENEPALPGKWVHALLAGKDGRLWIGTYRGLAVLQDNTFSPVPAASEPQRALDITSLAQQASGALWVGTTTGLYREQHGELHVVEGVAGEVNAVQFIGGDVWAGGRGQVHRLADGAWQTFALPPGARGALVQELVHAQGRTWAATDHGLYVLQDDRWEAWQDAPELVGVPVALLHADRDGNLWAGGDHHLVRILDGKAAEVVPSSSARGIRSPQTAYEDREGNLWFGTYWDGLVRVRNGLTRRYAAVEGLDATVVWSVSPDPDGRRTWVGTNDGLYLLDGDRFQQVVAGSELPHPEVYNLMAEPDRVWIGTLSGMAVLAVGADGRHRLHAPGRFSALDGLQVNGFVRTGPDTLWIPTADGLFLDEAGTIRRFGPEDGLEERWVRVLLVEPDGNVLAGTRGGLFEARDGRFRRLDGRDGLPHGVDVTAIKRLSDGRLLAGTLSEELHVLESGRWHTLSPANGMPANSPFFLAENAGQLWVAGMRGISRVAVDQLGAPAQEGAVDGRMLLNERGDPLSGEQGYCCNGAGNSKGFVRDGMLWLPTRDGVVAMEMAGIRINPVRPGVVIERVQAGSKWHSAHEADGLRFPVGARDLAFDFTLLSFQDPRSTLIEYRLREYDAEWQPADTLNRTTRYTNLPPGEYVFEVRGRNNTGVSSSSVARLPFTVSPYLHETAAFRGLLVVLALALVWGGYRYLLSRHARQRRRLEELVAQRTQDLAGANAQLQALSQTDPLTGLHNRRYMDTQVPHDLAWYDRELQRGRHSGEVITFALLDMDHFKPVNDTHGHHAGDAVLRQVADVLKSLVRQGDYVARWGGEEFLLVFRPTLPEHLPALGERLRQAVRDTRFDIGDGQHLSLTCSVGLAEYPLFHDGDGRPGWETMVELADHALYHVKSHGRDGWAAFRPTVDTPRATLLQELREGGAEPLLASGRLELLGTVAPVRRAGASAPA